MQARVSNRQQLSVLKLPRLNPTATKTWILNDLLNVIEGEKNGPRPRNVLRDSGAGVWSSGGPQSEHVLREEILVL